MRIGISICWLCVLLQYLGIEGSIEEDHNLRLLRNITKHSHLVREIIPIKNDSNPIVITFDIAYSQLVELKYFFRSMLYFDTEEFLFGALCIHSEEAAQDGAEPAFSINFSDSKNQILSSYIWVRQFWTNHRLSWNPKDFGGIKSVHVEPKLIWVPDIVLYNNINENTIGEMFKFDTKIIVRYDGYIEWFAPTLIKSICKIDITYFPFDRQTCKLVFGSWTFTSEYLLLEVKGKEPDLTKYTPNGEWDLIKVTRKKNVVKYSCCVYPYIDITYSIDIKRRPMFYIQNLIIPCILLATLSVLSFSLPPGSGERIALMITLLLGLTVYMLIFTENIPKTSEVVPLINKFFVVVLFEVAVCLLATSITLQFYHYHDPERDISGWLEFVIFSCLAKALRMRIKKPTPSRFKTSSIQSIKSSPNDQTSPILPPRFHNKCKFCNMSPVIGSGYRLSLPKDGIEDKIDNIEAKLDEIHKEVSITRNQERWHFAAMVLDRFFCIISALIIFVSLMSFYLMIPY